MIAKSNELGSGERFSMKWRILWGIVIVVGAITFYQVILRYQYVHLAGGNITRVDRLTGRSCILPCISYDADSSTTADTGRVTQEAISLVQGTEGYDNDNSGDFKWTADSSYTRLSDDWIKAACANFIASPQPESTADSIGSIMDAGKRCVPFSQFIVGHVEHPGMINERGQYWEVDVESGTVTQIIGNAPLEYKYGIRTSNN